MAHIDVSHAERLELREHGMTMDDLSYPTGRMKNGSAHDSPELLQHAFQSYGRESEGKRPLLRRYLVKRAVAMGRTDLIPDDWHIDRSTS